MKASSPGMRRYMYEYVFYRTVQRTQEITGKVVPISSARKIRSRVDELLAEQNLTINTKEATATQILGAMDQALGEGIPGYPHPFAEPGGTNPAFVRMRNNFSDLIGAPYKDEQGNVVQPKTGPFGPRLPLSPYDARWARRRTMKMAGSELLYISDADFEQLLGGRASDAERNTSNELNLFRLDPERGLQEAGRATSLDDISGMTELMSRMSAKEYNTVRTWVNNAALTPDGAVDTRRYMTPAAIERSAAILDELRAQGVGYSIQQDMKPGQIKAVIEGTQISVRITETRAQENYVGRIYDDGMSSHYSSTVPSADGSGRETYVPSPKEAVALVRMAQGKPVERSDGKGLIGGLNTHSEGSNPRRSNRSVQYRDAYLNNSDNTAMQYVGPLETDTKGNKLRSPGALYIRRDSSARSNRTRWIGTQEQADKFLQEWVSTARTQLHNALNTEALIEEYNANAEAAQAGEYFPEFDGDTDVAAIQATYWDVLRGAQETLLRPGATENEYNEKIGAIGELQLDNDASQAAHDMLVRDLAYIGNREQRVRDHARDVLDQMVGTFEPREVVRPDGTHAVERFNPGQVSRRMESSYGQLRNQSDLILAMRLSGVKSTELLGSDDSNRLIADRLINFDPTTAVALEDVDDEFVQRMGGVIRETMERNGAEMTSLMFDDQGIARYTAKRYSRDGKGTEITGEIGQIFSRGEHGEIVTNFGSGENYLFMPGYEARVAAQQAGEDKSVEERTLLRGYEQIMTERIQYQISTDMMNLRWTRVGDPASLNGVYRTLYDVRHEPDFIQRAQEEGLSSEWVDAILATEGRRVRYPSELASDSTVHAAWQAEHGTTTDLANDNHFDAWVLTGQRNMAIMNEQSDGYFDPVMTNGSVYQGITRYLVEGAEVTEDGRIVPGSKDDRTPLMKLPETESMKYDPYDRQQMSASNLLNASAVTEPVGVAMMTFGGWTADDPMVVSSDFAQKYGIRGADGKIRPLVPGDKLSDLHGNKGVISLVVDREMDLDEARELGLENEVAWFKKNSQLDVVMSPFSAVSRFNGGTARDLMQNPGNLDRPFANADGTDAEPVVGGLGRMPLIVTHKDVERGTRIYDDEALAEGKGRKASSQLAWALGSQGCDKIMQEFYGPNNVAAVNFREYLVTMGLDMEPDGTLRVGYDDMAEGNERRLFEMERLPLTSSGSLDARRAAEDFGRLIGDKGGDMELPFQLKLPTGTLIPNATDDTYKLPVLSSHLRSGHEMFDGVSSAHDYTNRYLGIHMAACQYRLAESVFNDPSSGPEAQLKAEDDMSKAKSKAQSEFNRITDDIATRRFEGKHNIFKESIMASRLPNSATAVWTSDPRLDVDQVAMGSAMAESLGFKEGDHALIWRDPVLRDGGVRYLRVAIDERLTGVAINPVMDKSFDGDFDGDSVAVVRLTSKAAHEQAMEKLSLEGNLVDLGQVNEQGFHPISLQNALDVKVSQHVNPELAERFEHLTIRANDIHADIEEGADPRWAQAVAGELIQDLSTYYREAHQNQFGDAVLRFDGAESHVKSVVEACIDTGAKGSMPKIEDYCRHLGVSHEENTLEDALAKPGSFTDHGHTLHTREEDQGVMMATAVKSHGTGIAGAFSQRGVKALRNQELKAVLELTYPVTQSVLQAKHDPAEAKQKYEMLMGPARTLWKGRKLNEVTLSDGTTSWEPARDERGAEIQATTEEWKAQFIDIYTRKDGLNVSVNPAHVDRVAARLSHNGTMLDMEAVNDPQVMALSSTMDRLAYGSGGFEAVHLAAQARENLFDGAENGHFAPHSVRKNQAAVAEWERQQELPEAQRSVDMPEVTPLVNRDVLAAHDPRAKARGEGRRSEFATSVRGPRPSRFAESSESQAQADEGMSL